MGARTVLGESTWVLASDTYEGSSDHSRVTVYVEDDVCFLECVCNEQNLERSEKPRRLRVARPDARSLVIDEARLNQEYPICSDTDRDVASVAEQLGLRVLT